MIFDYPEDPVSAIFSTLHMTNMWTEVVCMRFNSLIMMGAFDRFRSDFPISCLH